MCPIHVGHQASIGAMLAEHDHDKSMVIVGSIAQKPSYRVLFDFKTRAGWLRRIYGPHMQIVGAPDFPHDDAQWALFVRHLVSAWTNGESENGAKVTLYAGSTDDVCDALLKSPNYELKIIDRGSINVSATMVRDKIIAGESIDGLVPSMLKSEIYELGRSRFKKLDSLM